MTKEQPDQIAAFLAMVERSLRDARANKVNGEMEFKAHLRDGGLMDAYKTVRERVKQG